MTTTVIPWPGMMRGSLHFIFLHSEEAENFLAFQKNILVNFCSNDGCTALHEAVKSGQDGCVRLLVSELKADLSIRNNKNNGCLHLAVLNGRIATAEILISKFDCNPQSRGYKSRTLIHQSCQYGSVQLMDLLIQKNRCDLHAEDERRLTPYQ